MENKPLISIDEFKKLEIKIGLIKNAEKIPESEKLLKLEVEMGEGKSRQIISGIAKYFPNEKILIGKKCAFASNLEPRKLMGLESQGMILAVSGIEGEGEYFSLLETSESVVPGSVVK